MSTVHKVRTGRFRSATEEVVEPVERDSQKRHGLGLCLSGGGYRATLFHLGAARRLDELGILNRVDTFSSVSGGSIFAAVLAKLAMDRKWEDGLAIEDYTRDVAVPVCELTHRDLRTLPFLATWPYNFLATGPRARLLQALLARHLSDRKLGDLPKQPSFIFCATDLWHGINWESSRDDTHSYKTKPFKDAPEWPLAWAVAASACFPPVFGPMPLGPVHRRRGAVPSPITLSDGGLYDNMGLEPVWKSHACMLISDAGAPFRFRPSNRPLRRLRRYTSVVMRQAHTLRLRMFYSGRYHKSYKGAFWDIGTDHRDVSLGYSLGLIANRIALVRTDLDHFTEPEQKILENHGYWSAEEQVQARVPELVAAGAKPPQAPHPIWMDEERADHALRHSHRRFWPPRMVGRG
jgi:NTE family protein